MCIENFYAQSKDQKLFCRKVTVEYLFLKQCQFKCVLLVLHSELEV